MNIRVYARSTAAAVFGVVVPLVLLFQAYSGLSNLNSQIIGQKNTAISVFNEANSKLKTANDYYLFSMISAESVNREIVVNKQIMKISVMQIGFAVVSLGIMFIILGIRDGGGSLAGGGAGVTFDFRTGSTGAIVFVIGAAMATAGGVLKNEYQTVPIPTFQLTSADKGADEVFAQAKELRTECDKRPEPDKFRCFYFLFAQMEPESDAK